MSIFMTMVVVRCPKKNNHLVFRIEIIIIFAYPFLTEGRTETLKSE